MSKDAWLTLLAGLTVFGGAIIVYIIRITALFGIPLAIIFFLAQWFGVI